jgi:hypothetical protein
MANALYLCWPTVPFDTDDWLSIVEWRLNVSVMVHCMELSLSLRKYNMAMLQMFEIMSDNLHAT